MVKDTLAMVERYTCLAPAVATALRHAARTDFSTWTDGEHQIDGSRVRVLVQRYPTKPHSEGRWEAHRKHIDLQMVVSGVERIGVAPLGTLIAEPYDESRDLLWLTGSGDYVTLASGDFVVLWPEDGHMPGLQVDGAVDVLKAVYKIAVD